MADRDGSLELRLRGELTAAMKQRDRTAVAVLRTALAAIANAEAPPLSSVAREEAVGALVEHAPLQLSDADVADILRREVADREDTIRTYLAGGRDAEAAPLQDEVAVLRRYLA